MKNIYSKELSENIFQLKETCIYLKIGPFETIIYKIRLRTSWSENMIDFSNLKHSWQDLLK